MVVQAVNHLLEAFQNLDRPPPIWWLNFFTIERNLQTVKTKHNLLRVGRF